MIVIGSLAALVFILAVLVNQYWSPILAKEVRKIVLRSSDSLYTVDFSEAKLHVVRGEIVFYNIVLKPDTAVYNRKVRQHTAPNNLIALHVKRLTLSEIHPFKLYFQHKLEIGRVALKEPELDVSYQLNHTKDTTVKDKRTVWQKISKTLKLIHIGEIDLSDVQLKYKDYSGNKLAISELKEMNLSATDLLIDSATQTDTSRLMYCRDIDITLNNYSGRSSNGLYRYHIGSLKLSTENSEVDIQNLDLTPADTSEFFEKSRRDRFDAHLDSLQIKHFDYLSYHKYRIINASHMLLTNGTLNVFTNPHKKPPTTDKVKTYPIFGLKQIKADLNIDTIDLTSIDIIYSEVGRKSQKVGTVSFNNSSGRLLNVTTNKAALAKNNICTADLNSYFMNRARLHALFTFNLTAEDLAFSYKGSVGPMDLTVLNPAIMPLGLVKINTGRLNRFDFDIQANDKAAHGRISLLYDSLKVTVLKPDTNKDRLKHLAVASLFANILVLKHNNPDKPGETPRSFDVTFSRPPDYPFFKTIWRTLLAGIKPSVGLNDKMQQNVKAQIAASVQKKQERQVKIAERKQRR
ncbi:MAG TPA: hypothetical protein VHC47_00615, partial [Mucilaginibacter sp.]|nr:hypothetical protein [Mucilaginibacter sp.]